MNIHDITLSCHCQINCILLDYSSHIATCKRWVTPGKLSTHMVCPLYLSKCQKISMFDQPAGLKNGHRQSGQKLTWLPTLVKMSQQCHNGQPNLVTTGNQSTHLAPHSCHNVTTLWQEWGWLGPKRSIVLTKIYSKYAKQLIQIVGPKNIQHNVVTIK